jgi:hypothetical protein
LRTRRDSTPRPALTFGALAIAFIIGSLVFALRASAGSFPNPYPAESRGYDVSYPQCNQTLPEARAHAIIGVNRGRPFTQNPCLFSEYAWATLADMPPSLYMNISGALGSTADRGNTGPLGDCASDDTPCIAFNYGFNAAQDAYDYANSVDAVSQHWWLDVETANSWYSDTDYNSRAVQGAASFLALSGVSVGVYSTNYQWRLLMGDYVPELPTWYATATGYAGAPGYCHNAYNFAGGGIWLIQYWGEFDENYACGEIPPDTPTPTPTLPPETPTPTPTLPPDTPAPSATSGAAPTETETPLPSDTPTSTPTPTQTDTPAPTDTFTPSPTPTDTPTPTSTPPILADVSCDGVVDPIDSALVLQHDAGLLPALACQIAGDTNSDGAINAIDAVLILQFVAGLIGL